MARTHREQVVNGLTRLLATLLFGDAKESLGKVLTAVKAL